MQGLGLALVVALVGCTSVSIAAPRPLAWQPFRTTGTSPLGGSQHDTRVRRLPYVVRGDQLWIDAQLYGPHENDAWIFDLATAKWSLHTSSVFKVVWQPSINAGVPGAPSKLPPPRGRGYNIVLNQMSMGPGRWGYSLAVHDFARDRWSDLTHLLQIPTGDGTIFWHQIGDRLVQLTGTSHDARSYGHAQVIDAATAKSTPLFDKPAPEVDRPRYYYGMAVSDDAIAVFGGSSIELNMYDQQKDDKGRANAVRTGWLRDLRSNTTRLLPAYTGDGLELVNATMCFADARYLVLMSRVRNDPPTYQVLDLAAPNAAWRSMALAGVRCDRDGFSGLIVAVPDAAGTVIHDHDLATGTSVEYRLPKEATAARGTPTPDGDKLVFPPTATWRGGYYSHRAGRWTDFPAGPAQDDYALVAVADRVLVLWGKSTVTKRIKGGGCDGPRPANIGCDPVPDTVEWRAEPTGLVIGL